MNFRMADLTTSIQQEKQRIREGIKKKRTLQISQEIEKNSGSIIAKLMQCDFFKKAQTIQVYFSLPGEVQTIAFVKRLLVQGEKQILVPKRQEKTLITCKITSFQDVEQNPLFFYE